MFLIQNGGFYLNVGISTGWQNRQNSDEDTQLKAIELLKVVSETAC